MKKLLIAAALFFIAATSNGQGIAYNPYTNRNYVRDFSTFRGDAWKIRSYQRYGYSYGIGEQRLQIYDRYTYRRSNVPTSLDRPYRRNYRGYRIEIYQPGRR